MKTLTEHDIENAQGVTYFDEMDMDISPRTGLLVPVCVKHGVHVCWQCGDPFDDAVPGMRKTEKLTDRRATVTVMVHAKCVNGPPVRSFFSSISGLQTRRSLASAAKKSMGVAKAALEGAKKIVR